MVKINIDYSDLQAAVQEEVWALVSKQLLDDGWVRRAADESDAAFQDRLWAATNTSITTHPLTM